MISCAVLGVDPGVKGGMALVRADGSLAMLWGFNPADERAELVGAVANAVECLKAYQSVACFMEQTGYMPTDGGQGAFTFGRVNGLLEGALRALGVTPRFVYPQAWQAALGCLSGGNKAITKARAKALFPAEKITHGVADALLIAEYGRRRLAL